MSGHTALRLLEWLLSIGISTLFLLGGCHMLVHAVQRQARLVRAGRDEGASSDPPVPERARPHTLHRPR